MLGEPLGHTAGDHSVSQSGPAGSSAVGLWRVPAATLTASSVRTGHVLVHYLTPQMPPATLLFVFQGYPHTILTNGKLIPGLSLLLYFVVIWARCGGIMSRYVWMGEKIYDKN